MTSATQMSLPYCLVLWLWVVGFSQVAEGTPELLQRLQSKHWPWFGFKYLYDCPAERRKNWPDCFNIRPNKTESVLERAGIKGPIKLQTELSVVFKAIAEDVDVCGYMKPYKTVNPFKLNVNGFIIRELLRRGAEIYRFQPVVIWSKNHTLSNTVVFLDVGMVRIRGFVSHIASSGTQRTGKVISPYTPPANPSKKYINPVLVILLHDKKMETTIDTLVDSKCLVKGLSYSLAAACYQFLQKYFSQVTITGLQVFYTDGSSPYEEYRACSEGYFCALRCLMLYRQHIRDLKPAIRFTKVEVSDVIMYVNIVISSSVNFNHTSCCKNKLVNAYTFQAIPGNIGSIDDNAKLDLLSNTRMEIVFSGDGAAAQVTSQLYSILIVYCNVSKYLYRDSHLLPYGLYWAANIRYEEMGVVPTSQQEILAYINPTPYEPQPFSYTILLYSHITKVTKFPDKFYDKAFVDCGTRCRWNLSLLPSDFQLKGVNWFWAHLDEYSAQMILDAQGYESSSQDKCVQADPAYRYPCSQKANLRFSPLPEITYSYDLPNPVEKFGNPIFPEEYYDDPLNPEYNYEEVELNDTKKSASGGFQADFYLAPVLFRLCFYLAKLTG